VPDLWRAWQNHELPMGSIDQAALREIRSDPKLNALLHWYANFQTSYLGLDTFNAPLDNVKVRQALAHSIDRDTLNFQVMSGMFTSAYAMLPPGFPGWNEPELEQYQNFDVEKAKALMVEAGWPDGKDANGKQMEITIVLAGRSATHEYIQQQWQDNLGILVTIELVDGGVWGQRRAEHTMQVWAGAYEYDYLDPSNMLTSLWRSVGPQGSPRHNYLNADFDALLDKAAVEQDAEQRIKYFQDAEKILCEDVGGIFLNHNLIFQILCPYLTGIPADKNGNVVWRGLDITLYQAYFRNDVTDFRTTPKR